MGIGSLDSYYTSGSLYKKFAGSNNYRLNKAAVASYDAEVAAAGSLIFGQSVAESEGLSILAAQAMQRRIGSEFEALAEDATKIRSTAINILA